MNTKKYFQTIEWSSGNIIITDPTTNAVDITQNISGSTLTLPEVQNASDQLNALFDYVLIVNDSNSYISSGNISIVPASADVGVTINGVANYTASTSTGKLFVSPGRAYFLLATKG